MGCLKLAYQEKFELTAIKGGQFFSSFQKQASGANSKEIKKVFELSNHLGNVLVTVSDRKLQVSQNNQTIDYYNADVVTASDYYPFGMVQPGRTFAQPNANYRYSINGQEKEKELNENITTALYWEYDSRIGKRWNLDPRPSAGMSPYTSFGNNPIWQSDPLGDTARVEIGADGKPTGQLGQQFSFTRGEGLTDEQYSKMQSNFIANLNQQINNGGRSHNGKAVSLNTNDPLASTINVTFGATGTSNASMDKSSIYISWDDMPNANNTATHEWLHTAGLMDRYIEVYGYSIRNNAITINGGRSGTIPMQNLPTGYDNNYTASQNMMSVAGGQITQQQWSMVFAGVNERSGGGLGVVSVLINNSPNYPNEKLSASTLTTVTRGLSQMAFSGRQAYLLQRVGGTVMQVPYPNSIYSGSNPQHNSFILHVQGGAIYSNRGETGRWDAWGNKGVLNKFGASR